MGYLEKMNGKSMDLVKQNIDTLKKLFPEIVREGKIDFDTLKLILGEEVDESSEKFDFTWAGKKKAIRRAMQVSTGTLRPCKEESKNWDTTKNLYIEGDNLEVLRLLQQAYYNKIKMIYIDPPYNTGNDFVYNDDFTETVKEYVKNSGQALQSNPETSGRFHSNWLNMMYPRLRLARNLLKEDGVIFISIDNYEVDNLKKICNEIFGEENFRNLIIIKRGVKNLQAQFDNIDALNSGYEFVLMYSKANDTRFKKIYKQVKEDAVGGWNNHWRGTDRPTMRYELFGIKPKSGQWRWSKERSEQAIENYKSMIHELGKKTPSQKEIDDWYTKKIIELGVEKIDLLRLSSNGKPEHYIPPSNMQLLNDLWDDLKPNGSSYLSNLFDDIIFNNPKSVDLIKRLLEFITEKDDIILDFFSGSATTAHAVIQLNAEDKGARQFIMVQYREPCAENTEAFKAGYHNICEIGKERIRRAGDKIVAETGKTDLDIGFKVFKLDTSNLKEWDSETEDVAKQIAMFGNPIKEDRTSLDVVYEIMLKYGVDLTIPVQEETIGGKTVYDIGAGALFVCLDDDITIELAREIANRKPLRVVFKDAGFRDDNAKLNVVQILKHCGIEEIRSI